MTSSCFLVRTRSSFSSSCSYSKTIYQHFPSSQASAKRHQTCCKTNLSIQLLYQPACRVHKSPDHRGHFFGRLCLSVRRSRHGCGRSCCGVVGSLLLLLLLLFLFFLSRLGSVHEGQLTGYPEHCASAAIERDGGFDTGFLGEAAEGFF